MIYECTDCEHCVSFASGWRVFCMHPNLPASEVCLYSPVGDGDAVRCTGFAEGGCHVFTQDDLMAAEIHSQAICNDEVTYEGIRDWAHKELRRREGGR